MSQRQKGFSLIEMIVVTVLTSLLSMWAASSWMQQAEDAASGSMGQWLLTVKGAVDQMLARQADVMTGVGPGVQGGGGFGDLWRPSIAELKRAGHLSPSFSERAPLGYDVAIHILRPVGPCLTVGCKVEALTIASPKHDGLQDTQSTSRVGKVLEAMPGIGASVTQWAPRRIVGPKLDMPNPPLPDFPALPVGSIVLQSFHDTSAQTGFLRQDDRRHARLGADLSVAGQISANRVQTGQLKADRAQAGHLQANHVQANHVQAGHVRAGHLQVLEVATAGDACSAGGLIAQSSHSGLVVCQGGVWKSSARKHGGRFIQRAYYPHYSMYGGPRDGKNPVTGDYTCPPGYRAMLLSMWERPLAEDETRTGMEFGTFLCLDE